MDQLIESIGPSSPPCQEQTKTDCFKDTGKSADCDSIQRPFFSKDLGNELSLNTPMSEKIVCGYHPQSTA